MFFAFRIFLVCGSIGYQVDCVIFLEKASFVNKRVRFCLATWWHHAPVCREKRIITFFKIDFWVGNWLFKVNLFVFISDAFCVILRPISFSFFFIFQSKRKGRVVIYRDAQEQQDARIVDKTWTHLVKYLISNRKQKPRSFIDIVNSCYVGCGCKWTDWTSVPGFVKSVNWLYLTLCCAVLT